MDAAELLEIITRGEDGKNQFKANMTNAAALASEMVAFANTDGGRIFIGVNDNGTVTGLTLDDIGRPNQLLSNAASQNVHPPINPTTENVSLFDGIVMVVKVEAGISKPYMDNMGAIWVKSGADKRRVTSREEIQRMYQTAQLIHADELPAKGLSLADLDLVYFSRFFEREFGETIEEQEIDLKILLENMNLMNQNQLNLAGALLFAKNPSFYLPAFVIKAVHYSGNDIEETYYLGSNDFKGKMADVFQQSLGFVLNALGRIQGDQDVNSIGEPEIKRIVFEELLVNALIYRDYFISAPIRIFIFADRIEIISPGHLPNNLTVENIKKGNSNIRNPILASFATKILPYRGLGNGIRRALKVYPDIDFVDDREGNLFIVTIRRHPISR